jgi:hypothetical protein
MMLKLRDRVVAPKADIQFSGWAQKRWRRCMFIEFLGDKGDRLQLCRSLSFYDRNAMSQQKVSFRQRKHVKCGDSAIF